MSRVKFYQTACGGRFECAENEEAMRHLQAALDALDARTKDRETRGVEGLHEK